MSELDKITESDLLLVKEVKRKIDAILNVVTKNENLTGNQQKFIMKLSQEVRIAASTVEMSFRKFRPKKNYNCTAPGCDNRARAMNYCLIHYRKEKRKEQKEGVS